MKKSNFVVGILYILAGLVCLFLALSFESKIEGILWGVAGAGIGPGLAMIYKYFYWSSPKNKARYQEKLEIEKIEMHDELKTKIRDKSGRYAYTLGLLVISISILVFGVLEALGIIVEAKIIILFLFGYLVFQIIAGIVIFNRILKKY